tara:strand:- start:1149 stop:1487 length:339 start_codon:yes stop_codon:yes gene_type:complete
MDGLYQDVIIMLTIFICGLVGMRAYYKLRIDFDELQTDFHRLAEGRDYVEDIDQQAYAQGREWAGVDIKRMQNDIIDLKQGQINLNAKIKNNEIVTAMSRISVQDVISTENE